MYKISIQYTSLFKRYRTETICVTHGTDGTGRTDGRTDSGDTICSPPPPALPPLKMAGYKNSLSRAMGQRRPRQTDLGLRCRYVRQRFLSKYPITIHKSIILIYFISTIYHCDSYIQQNEQCRGRTNEHLRRNWAHMQIVCSGEVCIKLFALTEPTPNICLG